MAGQRASQTAARTLAAALVVVSVLFVVSVFVRTPGALLPWADTGLYALAFLLASALAILRGRTGDHHMPGWTLIGIGLFVYGLGNLVWAASPALGWATTPPSPADAFFLAFVPFAFAGLLLLAHQRLRLRLDRGWLDALVVGSGTFAVGAAVIESHIDGKVAIDSTGLLVSSVYLLGDLVLLAIALAVTQGFGWRPPLSWWLLVAGFATFAVTDGLYVVHVATDGYVEGTAGDIGWVVSAAVIGLAAWLDRPMRASVVRDGGLSLIAPSLAIVAAGVVLLAGGVGDDAWIDEGAALATIVLGVIRMNLSVSDATSFADRLRRAEVDPLTGLVNQRGLQGIPARRLSASTLVMLDLDGFREVNESLGRDAGDQLLNAVAARLRDGVRTSDIAARLGSDDFAVLLSGTTAGDAARAAETLIRGIEAPLEVHGVTIQVSASAGVAQVQPGASSLADALRDAGAALREAKGKGIGVVQVFAGATGERSAARLQLRAELRASLADGGADFVPHYQPIVRIDDGEILAVEALVRWRRDGQLLGPGEFLNELALAGAMGDLTTLMFERTLREMRDAGLDYPVTVNVPPDLLDHTLVDRVRSALQSTGSRADQVFVEILEDALIRDPEGAAAVLTDLRSHGVRVLLDDFGTGWSGFATLRDLMVDGLKIDSSFVSAMHDDPAAASIVHAVATVANDLDVMVVYEGAESERTIAGLRGIPGAYGQGFGLARPMPIGDLVRWSSLRNVTV